LKSGVAAVVAVHLYGVPAHLAEIEARCRQAGALLIEDAAQGVGGSLNGKPLGAHGDLSVLSFGRGKGRSAGGGGALLVRTPLSAGSVSELLQRLPIAEPSGLTRAIKMVGQDLLSRPALYGVPARVPALGLGDTPYHAAHPAMRMDARTATLVRAALELEGKESAARSTRAQRMQQLLPASAALSLPPHAVAGYLRMPVLLKRTEGRGERSSREMGIEPGYPLALCDLPGFTRASARDGGPWSGARALAARLVTLPVHSRVDDSDLQRAAAWASARIS
jgi:dTDP-4-amino-4,6-dideoxygalactose transaminase